MSRINPRKAMAALLPLPIKVGEGLSVRPMTLGMWAALERIGSPLVTGEEAKDVLELIPSLYMITHDPREVFKGNVLDLAMEWADTVPVTTMKAIQEACARQLNAAFDVMPEEDPSKKAEGAATTVSLPRSSTGPQANTDGPSAKSCGKSLSLRSSSSKGRRNSARARSSRSAK